MTQDEVMEMLSKVYEEIRKQAGAAEVLGNESDRRVWAEVSDLLAQAERLALSAEVWRDV